MKDHLALLCIALCLLPACEKVGKDQWSDIDYSRIARDNYYRENDSGYVAPPSVIGCIDDDLINCKTRSY